MVRPTVPDRQTDRQTDGQRYTIKRPLRDWRIKIFFSQTLVIPCYAVHAASKKKISRKFNDLFSCEMGF